MSKCPIFLLREDKRFQLREFPSGGQQQAWIQFYSSWAIQSISRDGRWDKGKELCFVIKCRVKVVICKMLQNALTENFKQISCALFLSDFPHVRGQLRWIHTYMGNLTRWGFSLYLCWFCFSLLSFFFSLLQTFFLSTLDIYILSFSLKLTISKCNLEWRQIVICRLYPSMIDYDRILEKHQTPLESW